MRLDYNVISEVPHWTKLLMELLLLLLLLNWRRKTSQLLYTWDRLELRTECLFQRYRPPRNAVNVDTQLDPFVHYAAATIVSKSRSTLLSSFIFYRPPKQAKLPNCSSIYPCTL